MTYIKRIVIFCTYDIVATDQRDFNVPNQEFPTSDHCNFASPDGFEIFIVEKTHCSHVLVSERRAKYV